MPYDVTKPASGDTLQASDDLFRADKTFVKNGLEREHHFDGTETAGASGTHLVHKMGSARVFIYDNATELTTGTLAATYSQSNPRNTGIVVVDSQVKRIWYCIDGATDQWIEQGKLGDVLNVVGELLLDDDLRMATTKKIKVPSAESFLEDLAVPATTMNPFTHGAARHQVTGSEGAWVRALDPLRGLLVGVKPIVNTNGAALTGSFVAYVSGNYNLTGRTQASRIVMLALLNVRNDANFQWEGEARLTVNGAVSASNPLATIGQTRQDFGPNPGSQVLFDVFDVASGTNHAYALEVRETEGNGQFVSGYLYLFDFGEVA